MGINQLYKFEGHTADGRPYFRGVSNGGQSGSSYLFYDAQCGVGISGAWIFGCFAPSTSSSHNLQGSTDGGCCNDGFLESDGGVGPPMGDVHAPFTWCGSQEVSGPQSLNLVCVPSPPSVPPPQPPSPWLALLTRATRGRPSSTTCATESSLPPCSSW